MFLSVIARMLRWSEVWVVLGGLGLALSRVTHYKLVIWLLIILPWSLVTCLKHLLENGAGLVLKFGTFRSLVLV